MWDQMTGEQGSQMHTHAEVWVRVLIGTLPTCRASNEKRVCGPPVREDVALHLTMGEPQGLPLTRVCVV